LFNNSSRFQLKNGHPSRYWYKGGAMTGGIAAEMAGELTRDVGSQQDAVDACPQLAVVHDEAPQGALERGATVSR
jgi:hypothetical protein